MGETEGEAANVGLVPIRRADERDLDELRRLWDASNAEITFTPYPGHPFDDSLITEHTALVAEEGGSVVGTVYVNTTSMDFGYVFGLYVVPEARRRGIAQRLMRETARLLAEDGRSHVVLSVDTPNDRARAFYTRLGFEDAARTLRAEVRRLLDAV
jgi:ribosomal protein S18 acetylase RimI-like enzyme